MDWIEPVFDRTQRDLDALNTIIVKLKRGGYDSLSPEEKDFWLSDLVKGAFNYTDLNRIENNINYISDILNTLGEKNIIVKRIGDWTRSDILYQDDLERIMSNFNIIIEAIKSYTANGKPNPYEMKWTYFNSNANWRESTIDRTWRRWVINQTSIMFLLESYKIYWNNFNEYLTWDDIETAQSWYLWWFTQLILEVFGDFTLNINSINVTEEMLKIMKEHLQ